MLKLNLMSNAINKIWDPIEQIGPMSINILMS